MTPLAILGAPGRAESRHPSSSPRGVSTSSLWRQPTFWLVVVANASIGYLLLLPAHHVAHLVQVGLPGLLAASAGGLMGACIGVGALVGGWATDRWGAGRLSLVGGTLMGFGVLALLASGPSVLWLVGIYVLFGGMGRGILGVNAAAFQARAFAGPTLGRVTGLLDLGVGLGAFAGPELTALARDQTGSYVAGLATAILAGLIAAVCIQVARRSLAREGLPT